MLHEPWAVTDEDDGDTSGEVERAEPFWCWQRLIFLGLMVIAALLVAGIACEIIFLY